MVCVLSVVKERTPQKKTCVQKRLVHELKISYLFWVLIVNKSGEGRAGRDLYDHLMSTRMFTLTMFKVLIQPPKL